MVEKAKSRFTTLILVFALVLILLPAVTLPAGANPWTPSTNPALTDTLPYSSGEYYLTQDITFDSTWYLNATVVIDLNGFGIRYVGDKNGTITIGSNDKLTIKDSNAGNRTHRYTVDETGLAIVNDALTGTEGIDYFTFSGGYITGGIGARDGFIKVVGGTFLMEGGTIIGNHGNAGGAISVTDHGAFIVTGGSIRGNTAGIGGGIDIFHASVTINGGLIRDNVAEQGGGIYVGKDSSFFLEGEPVITGNKRFDGKDNNVWLYDSTVITVAGALGSQARIGVTKRNDVGVFTSGLAGNGNADNFVIDNSNLTACLTDGGEMQLIELVAVDPPADPEGGDPSPADPNDADNETPSVILTVGEEPSGASNDEAPEKSGKGGMIALWIGLGVLLVAGGVVAFVFVSGKKKKNAPR